jgi:DNA-binding NarL/FixJ family response regulator
MVRKTFSIFPFPIHLRRLTQPLALVYHEKLMPGSQLVNKLQVLNYRVQTVNDPAAFHSCARDERPLLAIVDLAGGDAVCSAIAALNAGAAAGHIAVIAFVAADATQWLAAAQKAGAELVVSEAAIASHLPELLDQALHVE